MIINSIFLSHFRSYSKKEFSFAPGVTVILGDNGSGKTNLLEAIFLLAAGGSFRTAKDTDMLTIEQEVSRVNGEIRKSGNEEIKLEVMLTRGLVMGGKAPYKKYLVNGVEKRMIDFVGNLRVVLFWPEDLELVISSPGLRRRYLDYVLMQSDREYRRTLISYEKGLRQRNKLLEAIRDRGAHHHQLIFWDQLLIKNGEYIHRKREEYIDFINKFEIRNSKFEINRYQLEYDHSVISRQRLDLYGQQEIAAAVTLVGPHRDDIKFKIQNSKFKIEEEYLDLAHFGSRGEQRLGVLWLKLAELSYLEAQTGDKPVLLLDDIFSELDHEHRELIFDLILSQQTIMAATDLEHIEKKHLKEFEIIQLTL